MYPVTDTLPSVVLALRKNTAVLGWLDFPVGTAQQETITMLDLLAAVSPPRYGPTKSQRHTLEAICLSGLTRQEG